MIPLLVDIGGASLWPVLPLGVHWATLHEIEATFATNERRRWLFEGFRMVVEELARSGCTKLYLDGSYVTGKEDPLDYDGCWEAVGVDGSKLDPVFARL